MTKIRVRLYDGFEDVAAAAATTKHREEGSIAPYTPNDLWLPFINDGTTTEKNCLVLVGCKIFVSKLSPLLWRESGNELQSVQPPLFCTGGTG